MKLKSILKEYEEASLGIRDLNKELAALDLRIEPLTRRAAHGHRLTDAIPMALASPLLKPDEFEDLTALAEQRAELFKALEKPNKRYNAAVTALEEAVKSEGPKAEKLAVEAWSRLKDEIVPLVLPYFDNAKDAAEVVRRFPKLEDIERKCFSWKRQPSLASKAVRIIELMERYTVTT